MSRAWMVRAGRESVYIDDFLSEGVIAISWSELQNFAVETSKQALLEQYRLAYFEHSPGKAQVSVSQLLRFVKEFAVGDSVVTYDRDRRLYFIGKITSDYQWKPNLIPNLPRVRRVEWQRQTLRNVIVELMSKNTTGRGFGR